MTGHIWITIRLTPGFIVDDDCRGFNRWAWRWNKVANSGPKPIFRHNLYLNTSGRFGIRTMSPTVDFNKQIHFYDWKGWTAQTPAVCYYDDGNITRTVTRQPIK